MTDAATCAAEHGAPPTPPQHTRFPFPWSPRLTAVVLVAVVRAVVVLIASPHRGDAALVPTPKLVLFTLLDRPCGSWGL